MDLLATISSYFPSLSKSEKKVAQLILSSPDEVENLSINELALMAGVGESTIVRFARKIGLGGFQDLKIALVKYQTAQKKVDYDEGDEVKDEIYRQFLESLQDTRNSINQNQIDQAAEMIHQAEHIYIFAVGTSGMVAMQLSNRLKRLGKFVEYGPDGQLQSIYSTLTKPSDLVIAISTSGNTKEVIQNIELAQENGVKAITITNFINAPLTHVGDLSLVASSKMFYSDAGSFAAPINQLYLLDTLLKTLVELAPDTYHGIRNLTNQALMKRLD
ncbi:MurR/RpiR family transcriptional regulator [Enterococcus asini]|uniref:MurR/RpiR family transcriptional regulator n=1 Tax=Enterococcus asini TaxID=57732 RepID=UPI0013875502|nr:MurR/RpiR family transcriptional regulator [Enterococcus asini]